MNNEVLYNYNLKCIIIKKNRQKYQITNGNDDFSSVILSIYIFALQVKMLRDISVHMSPSMTSSFSGILNKFISQSCGLETGLIKVSHRSKGLRGRKEGDFIAFYLHSTSEKGQKSLHAHCILWFLKYISLYLSLPTLDLPKTFFAN